MVYPEREAKSQLQELAFCFFYRNSYCGYLTKKVISVGCIEDIDYIVYVHKITFIHKGYIV